MCKKCQHYTYCNKPCPAMHRLIVVKGANYEDNYTDNSTGLPLSIVYPPCGNRETCATAFDVYDDKHVKNTLDDYIYDYLNDFDDRDSLLDQMQSDRLEDISDIHNSDHTLKTRLWIDRFLLRKSWEDLAVEYNKPKDYLQKIYNKAKHRVETVLQYLDDRDQEMKRYLYAKQAMDKVHLDRNQTCYLLYTLFKLSYDSIADLTGFDRSQISNYVQRGRKKLHNTYDFATMQGT